MYKRRARLLVAAATDDGRARRVVELAADPELAAWLELRAAPAMAGLEPEALARADLLVALDDTAARQMPCERPATCRPKYWQLPARPGADFDAAALEALRCMAGGMRMLARMDEAPED